MCVNHIPSPVDNARRKIEHIYTGPLDTELVESMFECSPEVVLSLIIIFIVIYTFVLIVTEVKKTAKNKVKLNSAAICWEFLMIK